MKNKKKSEDEVFEDYKDGLKGEIDLSKAVQRQHDMTKAMVKISLRLDYLLLQKIKELADTDGLPYQTLIKILLREAIDHRENQGILERRVLKLEEKLENLATQVSNS